MSADREDLDPEVGRVNKREFVRLIARRAGVSVHVAQAVYDATIEEIIETVGKGNRLTLTGFGKFYPSVHKGHKVFFAEGGAEGGGEGKSVVPDYALLKFSATRAANQAVGPKAT